MELKEAIASALIVAGLVGGGWAMADMGDELQELRLSVPNCQEDENWAAVHHMTPGAVEDINGVSRMCVHYEDLLDQGIEVAIQNGVLQYAPQYHN
jgi:hypothetical protein